MTEPLDPVRDQALNCVQTLVNAYCDIDLTNEQVDQMVEIVEYHIREAIRCQ